MAETETDPTVAEAAEQAVEEEDFSDYVPPLKHDKQFAFNVGGPKPRSGAVKMSGGQVPIDGLLEADQTVLLLVEAQVQKAEVVHERGPNGEVIMNKVVQHVRPTNITRFTPPDDASAIKE